MYHALVASGVTLTTHKAYYNNDGVLKIFPEHDGLDLSEEEQYEIWEIDEMYDKSGAGTPQELGLVQVGDTEPRFYDPMYYVAYGNQASVGVEYSTVCLVATMAGEEESEPWDRMRQVYAQGREEDD